MKHERNGSEGKITLAPGETWIVDEQCMIMAIGYLADWQPYDKGDKFLNNGDREHIFSIDYGTEPTKCEGCGSSGFDQSVLGPGQCTFCDGTVGGHPPKLPSTEA